MIISRIIMEKEEEAIRRTLGVFCSTPIKIMSAESGLPTIIERRALLTGRLITAKPK